MLKKESAIFISFCLLWGHFEGALSLQNNTRGERLIEEEDRATRSSSGAPKLRRGFKWVENIKAFNTQFQKNSTQITNLISGIQNRVENLENEIKEIKTRQEKTKNETISLISASSQELKDEINKIKLEESDNYEVQNLPFVQLNSTEPSPPSTKTESGCSIKTPAKDCKRLMSNGCSENGVYTISPNSPEDNSTQKQVYCDMTDGIGGWTIIQRRGVRNISLAERQSFDQNWREYKNGFGSANDDHWIGLEAIHSLTKICGSKLKITLTFWNGTVKDAVYANFKISGESDLFRLTLGNLISDNIHDSLSYNNGSTFTVNTDCARRHTGGWWFKDCTYVNLNGQYVDPRGKELDGRGIYWWLDDHSWNYSYMKTQMKIQSNC